MEKLFKDYTIHEYIDLLKSDQPTVGGGNASALICAVSFSLAHMVASVTLKKDNPDIRQQLINLINLTSEKGKVALSYMDQDTIAFAKVMAAFKLEKQTDQQTQVRSDAILAATLEAAMVPYQVSLLALEAFDVNYQVSQIGLKSAYSDALSGCYSAIASCESALENVIINASSIKDEKIKQDLVGKHQQVLQQCNQKKALINR